MDPLPDTRAGLPDALRVLLARHPRAGWRSDPGFGPLTAFWLDRHLGFRRMLAAMQDDASVLADRAADPRRAGGRLAQTGNRFLGELHGHHGIEDQHYFPRLTALSPGLAAGFDLLEADHLALDREMAAFADLANAVLRPLSQGQGAEGPAAALHGGLVRLERFLDRHLTDEEDLIVPVILSHGERALD